ncbi:putative serine/threonine-protein kinase-like protein CCR3 isoform X2 [Andrographis paniculata]|uniref:putative serine/threonine-protein kinase-like protein CCR3 isoform X2 n=1 Tax=Andrographis paniculata TaxID=175694 RepID=UPI0021E85393|nr:putative serine/threonine-protein kinase-like protein CCR3 isoform X2 [Andrographis paniculata]
MTTTTTTLFHLSALFSFLAALCFSPPPPAHALAGSSSAALAVVYGSSITICTILADRPVREIQCWRNGQLLPPILPIISFDYLAGGRDTLCAVRSGGFRLLCWDTNLLRPKRIYNDTSAPLISLSIGDTQICALRNVPAGNAVCWRQNPSSRPIPAPRTSRFRSVSTGLGFSCGILENATVSCWGDYAISDLIQSAFSGHSMAVIQLGGRFACGINTAGFVICRGSNTTGQLNIPSNNQYEYLGLAAGADHICAIKRLNRTVVCWGGNVMCWGPGWPNHYRAAGATLPLQKTLPGPCIAAICRCRLYPQSQLLCSNNGHICTSCDELPPVKPNPPPPSPPAAAAPSRRLRRGLLAFAVIGSVGGLAGICTVIYCLWSGVCSGKKKVHNSVQPRITAPAATTGSPLRRQGSLPMRRQRSGTSGKHADRAEVFLFSDLAAATNGFSTENRIGSGSFGIVYRGKLPNGREVAIKRSDTGPKTRRFQEKESAFESELAFLSRLHHKHLVGLVGYCEERDERLLVYEYMKNGALYDHLHDRSSSSVVNSWKIRIKIALDAARGIEYLHTYAVPPIIHRDIKSSNILLDGNWTARVSDFGLSLMEDNSGANDISEYKPGKAAGTVGYIDPEYYGLNVLTAKSDVYGLGVVLLELLTGKRAIFKSGESGSGLPISVVDYAVPAIMAGEVSRILDRRVGRPEEVGESEAVELVAYTAMHCVHLEGKDRPTMSDVVANLERALALCDGGGAAGDDYGSVSSGRNSIVVSD